MGEFQLKGSRSSGMSRFMNMRKKRRRTKKRRDWMVSKWDGGNGVDSEHSRKQFQH